MYIHNRADWYVLFKEKWSPGCLAGEIHVKPYVMRQLQFIPHFADKPAEKTVFTAYFLTDQDLFTMAADVLETGVFSEKKATYQLKIRQGDGVEKSYYSDTFPREALAIFADYSRRRKAAQDVCEKRWPEFWRLAGEAWKVTIILFELQKTAARYSAHPEAPAEQQ